MADETTDTTTVAEPHRVKVPQRHGGALNGGGTPGNRGGYGRPDWLKRRMEAALRAGDAPAVAMAIMTRGDRDVDRLRAIDLAAELADLKPRKDVLVTVSQDQRTGEERMADLVAALPGLLASLPIDERQRLAQAVSRAAGDVSG
jgi:hypothetical protein